ncbi:MAG: permease [Bacillota bacterium]
MFFDDPGTVRAIQDIALYAGQLVLRVIPLLIAAVFLAESARLWLGDEKLKYYLAGRSLWTARLRAAVLGAVLPFCECGAFPFMLGLIRAGVPTGAVLTFFLVSPVVSMPAFMILIGVFGLPLALIYLFITMASAVTAGLLLEPAGRKWGMFKEGMAVSEEKQESSTFPMVSSFAGCETNPAKSCCGNDNNQPKEGKRELAAITGPAWAHTVSLLKRIAPYLGAVIIVSSLLTNLVPRDLIKQTLEWGAPFDVLIGALVGIPVYSGDCAMIALVAPLIGATGAVGAGLAFIISGTGTSINGIIFMNSIFKGRFLVFYVMTVVCIALIVGYIVSALLSIGLV